MVGQVTCRAANGGLCQWKRSLTEGLPCLVIYLASAAAVPVRKTLTLPVNEALVVSSLSALHSFSLKLCNATIDLKTWCSAVVAFCLI